jgi:hypothetical protein
MREISIVLTEPEAAALEELARRAGISVEEAAAITSSSCRWLPWRVLSFPRRARQCSVS